MIADAADALESGLPERLALWRSRAVRHNDAPDRRRAAEPARYPVAPGAVD